MHNSDRESVRIECPKCQRVLEPSGELSAADQTAKVYQCPECIRVVDIGGEPFDAALTFAVDASGNIIDPGSGDPLEL